MSDPSKSSIVVLTELGPVEARFLSSDPLEISVYLCGDSADRGWDRPAAFRFPYVECLDEVLSDHVFTQDLPDSMVPWLVGAWHTFRQVAIELFRVHGAGHLEAIRDALAEQAGELARTRERHEECVAAVSRSIPGSPERIAALGSLLLEEEYLRDETERVSMIAAAHDAVSDPAYPAMATTAFEGWPEQRIDTANGIVRLTPLVDGTLLLHLDPEDRTTVGRYLARGGATYVRGPEGLFRESAYAHARSRNADEAWEDEVKAMFDETVAIYLRDGDLDDEVMARFSTLDEGFRRDFGHLPVGVSRRREEPHAPLVRTDDGTFRVRKKGTQDYEVEAVSEVLSLDPKIKALASLRATVRLTEQEEVGLLRWGATPRGRKREIYGGSTIGDTHLIRLDVARVAALATATFIARHERFDSAPDDELGRGFAGR